MRNERHSNRTEWWVRSPDAITPGTRRSVERSQLDERSRPDVAGLGPVGSRIVAEVFVGLVQGGKDPCVSQAGWQPTLPATTPGTFFMTDFLHSLVISAPLTGSRRSIPVRPLRRLMRHGHSSRAQRPAVKGRGSSENCVPAQLDREE